jgi:hypothetical protein
LFQDIGTCDGGSGAGAVVVGAGAGAFFGGFGFFVVFVYVVPATDGGGAAPFGPGLVWMKRASTADVASSTAPVRNTTRRFTLVTMPFTRSYDAG